MAPSPPLTPEAMDVSSRMATEVDELDSEYHSDTEDPNIFRVRDPLKEAVRKHITTQNLHSEKGTRSGVCRTDVCSDDT